MKKEKAFSPERCSVMIPYQDLVRLLEAPARLEEMERLIRRMEARNAAMQNMYYELLEKIREIEHLL